LDEATSALDRSNEKLIQSTIQKISEDKITIAHRVKTIMDCDEVFVFDNGGLVEKGKFE
jgi:ABC-type multidrug transport system fused ATPase/permease subunit